MKTLVKKLALFALVLAAVVLGARPAQAQLGAAVGLNFENFSDVEFADREASLDNASGYHIGIFYDLAAGPLAIRPGVFYRQINSLEWELEGVGQAVREVDLSLVEIPVDLRFRLAALPIVKPYALAGPVFTFANTDDEDFEEALESFNVAANIGAGVEVGLPGVGIRLFPELRYSFGLSRFMQEEFEVGGIQFEAEDSQRLNTFMIRLGVSL